MKIVVKLCLILCVTFTSCGKSGDGGKRQDMVVKVSKLSVEPSRNVKEFSFITKPFRSSELSFRVGGPIERFEVYVGNYYKKGDVIASIDARDFRINKERAEAIYVQAKAEYERVKVLYDKDNISASAYEKVRADYVAAKTAFETAANELEDTRLVAPFDGYVGEVYIEKYQDVKPSQPVISFLDIHQLKIEAYVTQDVASGFQTIDEVQLRFDALPGKVYRARVAEVSKGTTKNNLSYLMTALIPNGSGSLLSGMSGKISVDIPVVASGKVVSVPQTALCHNPEEGDYVWVVDPGTRNVSRRRVSAGDLLPGGKVLVVAGLEGSEIVVTTGLRFLSEGMEVKITGENQV